LQQRALTQFNDERDRPARLGVVSETVAKQQPDARQKQQRGVLRQPRAGRLADHPGYAAVRRVRQDL
jgi:hypothetical protein